MSEAAAIRGAARVVPARWVRVLIQKRPQSSHWQPFRWELASVTWCDDRPLDQPADDFSCGPDEAGCFFKVTLYPDEADGYYLNCTSDYPAWFVHWRLDEEDPLAQPRVNFVTLSYNEAGRILDSGELVENLPVDPDTAAWLAAFTQTHFVPEPRKRQRPQSFRAAHERGEAQDE
jgi:hypothetical protein